MILDVPEAQRCGRSFHSSVPSDLILTLTIILVSDSIISILYEEKKEAVAFTE